MTPAVRQQHHYAYTHQDGDTKKCYTCTEMCQLSSLPYILKGPLDRRFCY